MRSLKRSLGCMFAICVLFSVSVSGSATADSKFRMTYPGDPGGVWGQLSSGLVEELKPQGIEIELYPESVLGGARWALDAIEKNLIDLAFVSGYLLAQDLNGFKVLNFPMLATDLAEAGAIVSAIGPDLADEAEKNNLKILGFAWIPGTFVSSGKCILATGDLAGAKVINGPRYHQQLVESVGGVPLPLPFGEVYSAMQAGLSNTGQFTIPTILEGRFYETTDCITDPSVAAVMLTPLVIAINAKSHSGLSVESREVLEKAAGIMEEKSAAAVAQMAESAVKLYRQAGKSAKPIEGKSLADWRKAADRLNEKLAAEFGLNELYRKALAARGTSQ